MIVVYKEEEKKLTKTEYQDDEEFEVEPGAWIHLFKPTPEVIERVSKLTSISKDMLMCSLDEEESARIDNDDGDTLIVLDTPYLENKEKSFYTTSPFLIAYNRSYYVTIQRHEFELMDELFKRVRVIEPHKHVRLTLNFVYRLATLFITYLKRINSYTESLETSLKKSTRNEEVLALMDTNKSLIYFSTALNANNGVLTKLTKSQTYKKFEGDFDLMEDAQVEMAQAIEMCTISRNVLASMMEAFSSIINNNMNVVMKTLAIITLVLSIPTLISSFLGMNFDIIPMEDNPWGFWITVGVSFALSAIGAVVLVMVSRPRNNSK